MTFISLAQAHEQWKELAAHIPQDDEAMLAESWNDYTDSLCKEGQLTALQYHYAPSYDEDMPEAGSRWDELRGDREYILEQMGFNMAATFVPFSHSRNREQKHPSINWHIALTRRARVVIPMADYMQGSAHCPSYKQGDNTVWGDKCVRAECETGFSARGSMYPNIRRGKQLPFPEIVDVFHALLLDSSVLDSVCFDEWADELGFSSDSIKARRIYDVCMETALRLKGSMSPAELEQVKELFEDM